MSTHEDVTLYCSNPITLQEHISNCAPDEGAIPQTSSGGDNDYWVARIKNPKRLEPYSAECEDLIEHFQMTFQEGEAIKALWRKGQMRVGNGKPGDTHLRNAQKVRHFGARMEAIEEQRLESYSDS